METANLLLLYVLIVSSTGETSSVNKRSVLDTVGGFFTGLWHNLSGNKTHTASKSICPGSIEHSLTYVSDEQLKNIMYVYDKIVFDSLDKLLWGYKPPALSQLVEEVRDVLGHSVDNLTDNMLSDTLFAIKVADKYAERVDVINAIKVLSVNIPLLLNFWGDCGMRRFYGL
ncbi:hypothetical protein RRG08_017443 [Elysia crispata]|uniref:Uncharacterized protein n=1 Tax=Elysia crispata TaxID=231223 RepID=A0AAE0XNN9_9GAST|nr:hypothetical protein RRG08_017443 [Elysia crispata]